MAIETEISEGLVGARLEKSYLQNGILGHRTVRKAVDCVTVSVHEGETVGIVGESGSGKSTLARLLLALERPDQGELRFRGRCVRPSDAAGSRELRKSVQIVFQNPLLSFNPRLTVGTSIIDPMRLRADLVDRRAKLSEAASLFDQVGLDMTLLTRYPSETSGGQLQRAGIARALAGKPRIIVLDEPTSSVDASNRGLIVSLLRRIQLEQGLGYVLISHDFAVISALSSYILVMYLGEIMEEGNALSVLKRPQHPYTRALLEAAQPRKTDERRWLQTAEVKLPPPNFRGCKLIGRCPFVLPECANPQQLSSCEQGHSVRCWRAGEIAAETVES